MRAKADKTIVGLVLASLIAYTVFTYPAFPPLPRLTRLVVGGLLNQVGIQAAQFKTQLVVDFGRSSQAVAISADCSGAIILLVFLFVIFISPYFTIAQKFLSFWLIPLVWAGNVVRIFLAVLLGRWANIDAMLAFHNTVGNVFMFMWAIICYMLWLKMIGQNSPELSEFLIQSSPERIE